MLHNIMNKNVCIKLMETFPLNSVTLCCDEDCLVGCCLQPHQNSIFKMREVILVLFLLNHP